MDGRVPAEAPESEEPRGVDGDDGGVMLGSDLDRAARHQPPRVAAREHQFAAPLQRDEQQDQRGEGQAARLSTAQLDVKPGPIALRTEHAGRPCLTMRSSTNRTVGEDMLPWAARTSRSWSSEP